MDSFPFQSPSSSTPAVPDISSVTAYSDSHTSHTSTSTHELASDLQVNIGALEVLHGLARRSSYTKTTPVAVKQAGNYDYDLEGEVKVSNYDMAVANDGSERLDGGEGGEGGVREMVVRIRNDLRTTQEDLVRAVKGWKKDREDYERKLEELRKENNVGMIKAKYMAEKKKLRGQVAALQAKVRDVEVKYSSTCSEYESKIQGLGSSVLDARLQREKERRSSRRKSLVIMSSVEDERRSRENSERECYNLRAENEELRGMLREAQLEVQRSRIGAGGGGDDARIKEERIRGLERENERLKAQLENRVKKPGRKPPKPPQEVDFGKYSGVAGLEDLLEPDF